MYIAHLGGWTRYREMYEIKEFSVAFCLETSEESMVKNLHTLVSETRAGVVEGTYYFHLLLFHVRRRSSLRSFHDLGGVSVRVGMGHEIISGILSLIATAITGTVAAIPALILYFGRASNYAYPALFDEILRRHRLDHGQSCRCFQG